MDSLSSITLSISTLLGFLSLPISYFIVQLKFWYRPQLVKFFNFLLLASAIILSIVVVIKFGQHASDLSPSEIKIGIAHLLPLGLVFFILNHEKAQFQVYETMYGPPAQGQEARQEYVPIPLNNEVERLSWDHLVVDAKLRNELISIIELLKDPETGKKYGIALPKGILFSGPPGTGKTTIAKVIANTANLAFFVLRADEVISKWVGDSEKNLTKLFKAAQRYAPAIIFIDEVDAIGRSRTGESAHQDNLLNHLLQLIDGVVKTEGLYIIAATNRPDLVDAALKRAGRLNRSIEIPLPDFAARAQLFALYLGRLNLNHQIPLQVLAKLTDGRSCADIEEICNQAGLNAFTRESIDGKRSFQVTIQDVQMALEKHL